MSGQGGDLMPQRLQHKRRETVMRAVMKEARVAGVHVHQRSVSLNKSKCRIRCDIAQEISSSQNSTGQKYVENSYITTKHSKIEHLPRNACHRK